MSWRPERAEQLAREISAVFAGMPHLYVSGVEVDEVFQRVSYLNSEGTSFVRASPSIVVRMLAGTQADDGTPLEDSVTARARSWPELPPASELLARARDLADGLGTLREATVFDRYTGPVLFEGQAAAALVRSVLAPRLLAVKPPVADDPRMASALGRSGNPFVDKLGVARAAAVPQPDGRPHSGHARRRATAGRLCRRRRRRARPGDCSRPARDSQDAARIEKPRAGRARQHGETGAAWARLRPISS